VKINRKSERGSTVVEFALILPIFLLLLFSLIDFGRYFYARVVIANASIEVASAITRGLYTEGDSLASKNLKIVGVLNNVAPKVAALSQLDSNATLTVPTPTACPNSNNQTTVSISTVFKSISPVATFINEVGAQSTMRCLR
jgi:Flp pilus assembly protein TadG